jgi:hypothetical protein
MVQVGSEWVIENNILAFNTPDAFGCRDSDGSGIRNNILFSNGGNDLGCSAGACESTEPTVNILADPLFCDPENDDYRVRADSPALTGSQPIGAFLEPGCPTEEP